MGKIYFEAQYRIKNNVFNSGFICIDGDTINCLFSLDYSYIKNIDGNIYFYLQQYNFKCDRYYEAQEFIGSYPIDILNICTPHTYILKDINNNVILSLEFIKQVCNPNLINIIETRFQRIFGK